MSKKIKFLSFILILTLCFSTQNVKAQTDDKSKSLIDALVSVNGGYEKLAQKKDFEFHYVYDNFDAGKDVSLERHILHGEHSWASYNTHQRNVLPNQKGTALQALVDGKPMLTLDGKQITDEKALGGTIFLRKVNFYWFTMMYKLKDPGTNYKYLGTEDLNGTTYDKVSLTYDAEITKKENNDEYILYFNPNTHLIDLFYFSLPDWGINKPILKMTLEYEVIDGLHISTKRNTYAPNKDGEYKMNGAYIFSDIKFNNGFKKEDFILK